MEIDVRQTREEMGKLAAARGAALIRDALNRKGHATIIVATGSSQFEMLSALTEEDIDWGRVTAFHLDEYIGLPISHPASFRKYLKERFVDLIPLKAFHYIDGEADPGKEISRLNGLIGKHEIDVAFIGIGENAHLAFNDPPADFKTEEPFIVVELDMDCRKQQFNEGWFPSVDEVPGKAISMSVNQILKSDSIICTVPGERKAKAVKRTFENNVTPLIPATILKSHNSAFLFLDRKSSSALNTY